MSAIDSALEAVSVVFLLAALLYSYRLSRLTKGAEIVALARPKTFFASILFTFAALLIMELVSLINDLVYAVPYLGEITRLLVIVSALSAVYGLYTAVYYYRTTSKKIYSDLGQNHES